MSMLSHYVRVTLRGFRRDKLPAAVNVLSLCMGLMGFIAAYAVSRDMLSVGARYPAADRIHVITQSISADNLSWSNVPLTGASVARYLAEDLPDLEAVARITSTPVEHAVAVGENGAYQTLLFADPDYLKIFPETLVDAGGSQVDDPLRQQRSAVISPAAARTLFGDANAVGRTFRLADAVDVTVAGLFTAAPIDQMGSPFDLIVSMDTRLALERAASGVDSEQAGQPESWQPVDIITFAVLPADGSLRLPALEAHLATFAERHIDPDVFDDASVSFGAIHVSQLIVALVDMLAGGGLGISITSLIMLVGILILAMSCLNYANLAAAQAFMRAKHIGLLKVLGAKRSQVLSQALIEAALLVTGALVLALIAAEIAIPFVNDAFRMTMDLPYTTSLSLWAVLLALIAGVGVVAGGYPALLLARIRPVTALRAGSHKGGPNVIRKLLVGTQFTVASILIILVLVMFGHNRELRELGADAAGDPIVVISSQLPEAASTREAFAAELASDPSIVAVSATGLAPWSLNALDVATMSRVPDMTGPGINFLLNDVDYDFFATMGSRLLAGRPFSREHGDDLFFWGETPEESVSRPLHAVIDRNAARRFGWEDPAAAVGQTVHRRWSSYSGFSRPVEIVGVVENAPYKLVSLGIGSATVYFLQPNDTVMHLVRIAQRSAPAGLAHIDRTWDAFVPNIPIKREFMDERFDEAYEVFEIFNGVFAGLAIFAILVACVGLFGAATYATGRRIHEIGVRKTLGASSKKILRMLIWDFSKPVLVANLIAWPVGFLAMQIYFSLFVFRADTMAAPFIGSLVLTLGIAWLAVAGQTYRASRVQPAKVLRQE